MSSQKHSHQSNGETEVNLKKEIEFDQFNIEKLDINWWMKKINKYKVEPIVDKIKVRISDTQLIQIENRFYKLRNRNARKKTIFTFLRKVHQKISILHKT